MDEPVTNVYQKLTDTYPLVRPTYNQLEVALLPPYGDPEVHVPSEVGTYFVTGLFVNLFFELLRDDSHGR